MSRLLLTAAAACVILVSGMSSAEARIFEPQRNWWSSGHLCAASRNPPGRRWRAMPPRSCNVERDVEHAEAADLVGDDTTLTARDPYWLKLKMAALAREA